MIPEADGVINLQKEQSCSILAVLLCWKNYSVEAGPEVPCGTIGEASFFMLDSAKGPILPL